MKNLLLLFAFCFGCIQYTNAQDVTIGNTTLTQSNLVTGIQIPWEILWGADDHIWITERRGRVLRVDPNNGNTETILNIQSQVESGGEPGLLGMALHPDFANSPLVYLAYTYAEGWNVKIRISSFEWNGTELINENTILEDIIGGGIHNGTRLLILPDNTMMATTGDGGDSSISQDMNSLSGKTIRMNLDGTIPADNPDPNSYVWSYGHRNAQGLCNGPNGIIYSSEHGAQSSDEFNVIEKGRNYGWPFVQGQCNTTAELAFCNANDVREPLTEYSPCIAVNGVEYYDHPAIPELQNSVLMAVLGGLSGGAERITQLKMSADGLSVIEQNNYMNNLGRLRDICINPYDGSIYVATNGPQYPGSGPNRIVQYTNEEYVISNTPEVENNQFIKVFPNPMKATGTFTFSENFIGSEYEVISFNGEVVMKKTIVQTTEEISTAKLPAGMYYIKAENKEGFITKTFVVQ